MVSKEKVALQSNIFQVANELSLDLGVEEQQGSEVHKEPTTRGVILSRVNKKRTKIKDNLAVRKSARLARLNKK